LLNCQRVWYIRNIDGRQLNMAYNSHRTVHIYQKVAHTWLVKHKMSSTEIHFIDNSAGTERIPVHSMHCSFSGLRFSPLTAVGDILARTFPTQYTFFNKSSNSFNSTLHLFKTQFTYSSFMHCAYMLLGNSLNKQHPTPHTSLDDLCF